MEVQFIQLDLSVPAEISLIHLRTFILKKLSIYGDLVRWAIISIDDSRNIKVEATYLHLSSEEKHTK